LQSGVKNVVTNLGSADLQSAAKEYAFPFCWGITNPPDLIGRTFFYGGFQIRRDAIALGFDGPQTRRPVRAKALKPDD